MSFISTHFYLPILQRNIVKKKEPEVIASPMPTIRVVMPRPARPTWSEVESGISFSWWAESGLWARRGGGAAAGARGVGVGRGREQATPRASRLRVLLV